MTMLNIAMAQINSLVGDIVGNTEKVLQVAMEACERHQVAMVIFPELTLTGYPPEDLLLRPSLEKRIQTALDKLCNARLPCYLIVGYPKHSDDKLMNMAGVIHDGRIVCEYAKQCLPNYRVFDEKRYFIEGNTPSALVIDGVRVGITICEDLWDGRPLRQVNELGIDLLVNLNASPFHSGKQKQREHLVAGRARELGLPIVFVNWIGGQDELVFDGGSVVFDANGELVARSPQFEEDLALLAYDRTSRNVRSSMPTAIEPLRDPLSEAYEALVLGVRDYVNKNRFNGVVLGLSGGIDSALTLAIACDAIGPDRVSAVMMPFRYTSQMSVDDARAEAEALGVHYHSIGIEPIYTAFMDCLKPIFGDRDRDTTEENIQARSRGVLLMAMSNKLGYLVLTTGNKSEMAVGYATLYGDMAGGLDVLKDVPKTMVFALARYRNSVSQVIPESVITRPPSAELAPDQKDEDSLPPYDVLDRILELYIEEDLSHEAIVAQGFDPEQVRKTIRLVDLNEYKRRQAPIGIRISERAFGRDRRYPITNGWHIGD